MKFTAISVNKHVLPPYKRRWKADWKACTASERSGLYVIGLNQTKPNLLKAEGPMVTNTAKSNITYTEIKTKQYKLWKKNLKKKHK